MLMQGSHIFKNIRKLLFLNCNCMKPLNSILSVGICFILFLPNKSVGQSKFIEYEFEQNFIWKIAHASVVSNGSMVPFMNSLCGTNSLAYINKNTGRYNYITDTLPATDIIQIGLNEFIIGGVFIGGDVPTLNPTVLYEIDSLGDIKWKDYYYAGDFNKIHPDIYPGFTKVISLPGGYIFALCPAIKGGSFIAKTDKNGKKLWVKHYQGGSDFIWSGGYILMADSMHIFQLDTSGVILKDHQFKGQMLNTLQNGPGNSIYASNNGKVIYLDSGFNILNSVTFKFNGI